MGALHTAPTPGNVAFPTSPPLPEGNGALGLPPGQGRRGQSWSLNPDLSEPDPFIPGGQSTGCPARRTEALLVPQPGPRVWQRATPGGRGLCLAKPGRHHRPGRASTSPGGPTARPALSQPRQRAERRRGLAVTPSPGRALLCPLHPIPERPCSGQGDPGLWTCLSWSVWTASQLHFCKCLRLELAGRLQGA